MTAKRVYLLKKILMIGAGLLMIGGGIYSIANLSEMSALLINVLGAISLMCGVGYIIAFVFMKRSIGSGFLLADGIVTVILGLLILCNRFLHGLRIDLLFTLLLVLIGVSLIRFSFEAKNFGVPKWWILLTVGIVCIIIGVGMLINPKGIIKLGSITAGIALIVGGIATIFGMIVTLKNKDKIVIVKDSAQKDDAKVVTLEEKDIEFVKGDATNTNKPKNNEKK